MSESFIEQTPDLRAASELNNAIQMGIVSGSRDGITNGGQFEGSFYNPDANYLYTDGLEPDLFSRSSYGGNVEDVWSVTPGQSGGFVYSESDHVERTVDRIYGGIENFQLRSIVTTANGGRIEVADAEPASYADETKTDKYAPGDDRFRSYTNSHDRAVRPAPLTITRTNRRGEKSSITLTGEQAVLGREIMHRRVAQNIGVSAIARVSRPPQRTN